MFFLFAQNYFGFPPQPLNCRLFRYTELVLVYLYNN